MDPHVALAILDVDRAALADPGQQLAVGVGQRDVDVHPERGEHGRDLGPERLHAVAGQCRDEDRATDRRRDARPVECRSIDQVGLVEYHEPWLVARAQLIEDSLYGGPMLVGVRICGIDHLEQDVCAVHLLEGRPEGIDQLVWQLVDEAHRIGHDRGLAVAELDLPAGRVERGEELVLGGPPRRRRAC